MNADEAPPKKNHRKRNLWLASLTGIFLLAGLVWFVYWLLVGRFYVYTDDAYIHGNQVMLTPQVSAGVKAIYADDTDLVEKGQLVVELDKTDYEIRFGELKQRLANTVRKVTVLFQDVISKEAEVVLRAAELRQAQLDLKHREPLVKTGAVSREVFETYQTSVVVAESKLSVAQEELKSSRALVQGTTVATHPRVQDAVWELRQAYLDLIRCQIWAPATGYIGKRAVQVGDQVTAGQTLLFIVPLNDIWVEANYKETKLKKVQIGQSVEFTADIYGGGVKYHGHVVGFQPGSGSAFSLLPPENASGNWIKIIQRVPVRISIPEKELRDHPLILGLSMRVHVDVHKTSGHMLSETPTEEPIYTTDIYSQQVEEMEQIEPLIDEIIKNNTYL